MRNSYRDPHGRAIAIVRVDALEIGRASIINLKALALPPLLHIGVQPRLVVGAGRVLGLISGFLFCDTLILLYAR
ncbi:MAG: hypothetical protein A3A97_02575 [Candidatus Terrybacteria bacterium RIFCSPLOWO2_01_FULL_40_23]|uniref:Uncharacterized protein n=1 Tax=Candidatus Terrybacteria bacterium RIFCSPLOWO2_01_FULL_40_23 TaxID=1802366 RepID=A0A1G2PVH0_9BACT|nr:MAG: hypothetical protein A3A97_02575 [Candidatus Terrybacteria bacterium RIFCSPLOWO2_01_FULL_40_23]